LSTSKITYAEIHEEAGAFTVSDIDTAFMLVMPTQDQYESYDIRADIKKFKDIGDASRIAMMLQADASIRQKASWFSLEDLAGDKSRQAPGSYSLLGPQGPNG
jgi:hypothetical protein